VTGPVPWRPAPAELAALEAEHRERVARLDPFVVVPDLAADGAAPAGLLAVRLPDGSRAAGVVTTTDVDARSSAATFRALREHRLRARAAGPDVTGAVAALLDVWTGRYRHDVAPRTGARAPVTDRVAADHGPAGDGLADHGLPDDRIADHGLAVAWPSRDVEAVAALAASGLRPSAHLAARRGARPPADGSSPDGGPVLRDATPADVDAVLAHQLDEIALDALVGAARVRPGAAAALRPQVAAAVGREDSTVLVAQAPGAGGGREVVGVVAVEPPRLSRPVAAAVTGAPAAYLVLLHVGAAARGRGTGTALVDAALRRVHDRWGPGTTVLLHHGVLNPLSAPFWARHGFRPVLTTWELAVTPTT